MHHIDLTQPRDVACAWSAIVEPGDEAGATLRRHLGSAEALEWLLSRPEPENLPRSLRFDARGQPRPWLQAIERWLPRIEALNVAKDLDILSKVGGFVLYPEHPQWPSELNDLGLGTPRHCGFAAQSLMRPELELSAPEPPPPWETPSHGI